MSSKRIISDSVSSDKPEFSTFPLSHTAPSGRTFSYTLTRHTRKSYSFESHQTGNTKAFESIEAFQSFWSEYKAWISTMNPAEVKLLPAKIAALSAPTTEQIVRIDVASLISTSECTSCRNTFAGDSDLCPTCTAAQSEIVETLKPRTAYDAKNELRKLFLEKMSVEAFKTRRTELLEEIAELEAAEQAARLSYVEGEYFHKTDIALAISQYSRKYGRKPTMILLSKYDHVPAGVDVTGIDAQRSSSVLPGDVHVYAPKTEAPARPPRMAKLAAGAR